MTPELAGAVFDELLPGWSQARLVSGNRRTLCPLHDDHDPSFDTHEEKLTWICRAGCGGGGAWDLAVRMRGEDGARDLLARLEGNGTERPQTEQARRNGSDLVCHQVEILGDPTSAQIVALKRSRRLKDGDTLRRIGVKLVRARFRKDANSPWGPWAEWLGFPTVSPDSWKLWALNGNGVPRLDDKGKLIRLNAGPTSLILSPALREAAPGSVSTVNDEEGESDFLAAVEAGFSHVLTGTGGAGSLGAHDANAAWLRALHISEARVWGDCDESGRRGAEKRAAWWLELGVPVRVPVLPEALGEAGDVRDFLNGRIARDGRPAVDPLGDARALDVLASAAPLREPERRALEVDEDDEDQYGDELDNGEGGALELPSIALRGSFRTYIDYLRPVTGASPAYGFASWLSVVGPCIGSARWGTWSGRVVPVFYSLLCGPTGDHKSTPMAEATALLPDGIRYVSGCTSDAGLFDALEAGEGGPRPVLLHFDELGFLLKMAALSGSTLNPMLNQLWSAPAYLDRNLSRRNKEGGGARRLERPFAGILGGTQPETFWRTIGDPDLAIASGFVNRLAVFASDAGHSLKRTAAPDESGARSLRGHLEKLVRLEPGCVSLASNAEALWDNFAQDQEDLIRSLPTLLASVTKRVRDHVARLALVFASDEGRTQVSSNDLRAAIEVGAYLERSYRKLLEGRQADRGPARAADLESIARGLLAKRPAEAWQTARALIRGWPNGSRPSSVELRRVLQAMDGVEAEPARGRRKERYRLTPRRVVTRHTTPNPSESEAPSVVCRVGVPRAE